jgi:hypothetical protein
MTDSNNKNKANKQSTEKSTGQISGSYAFGNQIHYKSDSAKYLNMQNKPVLL